MFSADPTQGSSGYLLIICSDPPMLPAEVYVRPLLSANLVFWRMQANPKRSPACIQQTDTDATN